MSAAAAAVAAAAAAAGAVRPMPRVESSPGVTLPIAAAAGPSGGAPSGGTSAAGGSASAVPKATAAAAAAAVWKSESEETVKTRRNALRVIINKFRNFFPTEGEEKLTKRAALLERSVFDVTVSKPEYITRLQRDLNTLTSKKEVEKKAVRQQAYAQAEGPGLASSAHLYTADAKAKWHQKVFSMERKHAQIISIVKQGADARAEGRGDSQEQQMRALVHTFLATSKGHCEKGPWDVATLNKVDERLENIRSGANTRARALPSRDSVDRQNDRTRQAGARALDKLRKLNKERPFVVLDLAWSMEQSVAPALDAPPELSGEGLGTSGGVPQKRALELPLGPAQGASRARTDASAEAPHGGDAMEVDGGVVAVGPLAPAHVRPWRSSGGDDDLCVPSVRESHVEGAVVAQAVRGRGFIDTEAAIDSDHFEALLPPEAHVAMPLAMAPALEQLSLAAATWRAPGFLAPEGGGGEAECKVEIRQEAASRSGDGEMRSHTISIEISAEEDANQQACPWDMRVISLRRLPIRLSVSPACLLNADRLMACAARGAVPQPAPLDAAAAAAASSSAPAAAHPPLFDPGMAMALPAREWLHRALSDVAAHLACLHALWLEVHELSRSEYGPHLRVALSSSSSPAPSGIEATIECLVGEGEALQPTLLLSVDACYPLTQPRVAWKGLSLLLASSTAFEARFAAAVAMEPAPLSLSSLARALLETHGAALAE